MSCLFCCFKTFSLCGFRDCMIGATAFRPPSERKYELKIDKNDIVKGPIYKMLLKEQNGATVETQDHSALESCVVWLETKTHKQIPALFIENRNCKSNIVILYSHGNSTDLGRMQRSLQDLSLALNVHVFAYEYNGYGPTKGGVSEYEVIFGIMAAYEYLTERLWFKWYQIILYGRSIGSGPSVYLASHPNYPVSGLILHSPIASGLRVFNWNFKKTDKLDMFPNCDYIEHVRAHAFIIHGEADAEVPSMHGKLLAAKCKNLYNPWWVQEGNHNDIDYTFRRAYFIRIGKFLKYVNDFNLDRTPQELEEFYKVKPWHHQSEHVYIKKILKIEENYDKYMQKNRKKTLKDQSFISEPSLRSQKSLQQKILDNSTDDIDEAIRRNNEEYKQIDETEIKGIEGKPYKPPKIPVRSSRSCSLKVKSKMVEIEFSSNSFSSEMKYFDESDMSGPREVRFNSEKISSKEKPSIAEFAEVPTTDFTDEQKSDREDRQYREDSHSLRNLI